MWLFFNGGLWSESGGPLHSEQNVSHLPSFKTVFASSTSPRDFRPTINSKCNFCTSLSSDGKIAEDVIHLPPLNPSGVTDSSYLHSLNLITQLLLKAEHSPHSCLLHNVMSFHRAWLRLSPNNLFGFWLTLSAISGVSFSPFPLNFPHFNSSSDRQEVGPSPRPYKQRPAF